MISALRDADMLFSPLCSLFLPLKPRSNGQRWHARRPGKRNYAGIQEGCEELGEYSRSDLQRITKQCSPKQRVGVVHNRCGLVRMQCALRRDRSLGGMWKRQRRKLRLSRQKGTTKPMTKCDMLNIPDDSEQEEFLKKRKATKNWEQWDESKSSSGQRG